MTLKFPVNLLLSQFSIEPDFHDWTLGCQISIFYRQSQKIILFHCQIKIGTVRSLVAGLIVSNQVHENKQSSENCHWWGLNSGSGDRNRLPYRRAMSDPIKQLNCHCNKGKLLANQLQYYQNRHSRIQYTVVMPYWQVKKLLWASIAFWRKIAQLKILEHEFFGHKNFSLTFRQSKFSLRNVRVSNICNYWQFKNEKIF